MGLCATKIPVSASATTLFAASVSAGPPAVLFCSIETSVPPLVLLGERVSTAWVGCVGVDGPS